MGLTDDISDLRNAHNLAMVALTARMQLRLLQKDLTSRLTFFRHLSKVIGYHLVNCCKATLSVHGKRDARSYES